MPDKLPYTRILLGTLAGLLLLTLTFGGMTYYRMTGMSAVQFAPCDGLDQVSQQLCVQQVAFAHLTDSHWTAAQFSTCIFVALLVGFFTGRGHPSPFFTTGVTGALTAVSLFLVLGAQGRMPAIAAIIGYLLVGLILQNRRPTARPEA